MRNKLVYIIPAAVLALAFALGLAGVNVASAQEGAKAFEQDRLVGVFITREPLDTFDEQAYFEQNGFEGGEISMEETLQYQNRLYAEHIPGEAGWDDWSFGVEGMKYLCLKMSDENGEYTATYSDPGVCGGGMAMAVTDEGDSVDMSADIYVHNTHDYIGFFVNPVYQDDEGGVYALSGSGISSGGDMREGSAFSQKLESSTAVTSGDETKTDSITVEVRVNVMYPPESIALCMYDKAGALLARDEYAPGTLPERVKAESGTAYIIVSTLRHDPDGAEDILHELYQRDDGGQEVSITTYALREGDIFEQQQTGIDW